MREELDAAQTHFRLLFCFLHFRLLAYFAGENKPLPSGYANSVSWKLVTSYGNTTTMFLACEQASGEDGKKKNSAIAK